MTELTLYMKAACHLCHNAIELLETLQAEYPFTIKQVDILQDKTAFDKHWEYIPVVEIGGRIILTAPISEETARKAFAQLRQEGVFG